MGVGGFCSEKIAPTLSRIQRKKRRSSRRREAEKEKKKEGENRES
jgi:hypothetical protein